MNKIEWKNLVLGAAGAMISGAVMLMMGLPVWVSLAAALVIVGNVRWYFEKWQSKRQSDPVAYMRGPGSQDVYDTMYGAMLGVFVIALWVGLWL